MTIKPESIPSDVVEKAARATYDASSVYCDADGNRDLTWPYLTAAYPEAADVWRDYARAALAAGLEAVAERVEAHIEDHDPELAEHAARLIRFEE